MKAFCLPKHTASVYGVALGLWGKARGRAKARHMNMGWLGVEVRLEVGLWGRVGVGGMARGGAKG